MVQTDIERGSVSDTRGGALRRWRWPLILGGPIVILLVVGFLVLTGRRYESTDNAYVQVAKSPVAPSIAGRVLEIYVKENQVVHKGQLLFRIDPRDFQANAAAAQAQLAQAEVQVRAQRAAYAQAQASAGAARELSNYTASEAARQKRLAAAGVTSQQTVAQALNASRQAQQQAAAAQQQVAEALANLGGSADAPIGAHPAVMQAQAMLQRARLNVSYTDVVAPADGIVTRVEQLPVGTYLNASQTAFWLLAGKPWVEANFKEDQLSHMKVGQVASIRVDAYPQAKLTGRVASFSPGTGAAFSALPAQNATGNWVKVVQRLPVRIEFDGTPPVMAGRSGLSARVKVDVRASGHSG